MSACVSSLAFFVSAPGGMGCRSCRAFRLLPIGRPLRRLAALLLSAFAPPLEAFDARRFETNIFTCPGQPWHGERWSYAHAPGRVDHSRAAAELTLLKEGD